VETRRRKPPLRIPGQWRNVGDDRIKERTTFKFRGKYHSLFGIPVSFQGGRFEWYKRGELHKADGPLVVEKIPKQELVACMV
jgi:hypothetical protein